SFAPDMFPPAGSPTGGPAFWHAAQNQSSKPSVHHAFWCGWLKVNRNPSMPGRSRQRATMFSRSGLWRSKCPRMQNLVGCLRTASTASALTASPSALGGRITAQSTPGAAMRTSAAAPAAVCRAVCDLWEVRTGRGQEGAVDARQATASLRSGHYMKLDGAPVSTERNTVMGVYPAKNGRWSYLHCNFPNHRAA